MSDAIDPSHYKDGWSDGAELISITENLNFNRGNAVKYIARAGRKNPATEVEDLEKALWYLSRELKRIKGVATIEMKGEVLIRDYAPAEKADKFGPDWRTLATGGPVVTWSGESMVDVSGCGYSNDRLARYNLMQAINGMDR